MTYHVDNVFISYSGSVWSPWVSFFRAKPRKNRIPQELTYNNYLARPASYRRLLRVLSSLEVKGDPANV